MNRLKQVVASMLLLLLVTACNEQVKTPTILKELPAIYPDYVGVTIPATIAPLNFTMKANGFQTLDVVIKGARKGELHVQSRGAISIPADAWKELLEANRGDALSVTVCVKSDDAWKQYQVFPMHVSSHPIDYGLVYRLIAPGYKVYAKMGIYERNLSSFAQRAVFENTQVTGSCVNCHSFNRCNPKDMCLHIRGGHKATILQQEGSMKVLNTKADSTIADCVYPYWHSSGRYIAFSLNNTRQGFHVVKDEKVEVFDLSSDVIVYDTEKNEILKCDLLTSDKLETFPSFSPDGKTLYFCAAEAKTIRHQYKEIRYNLCSIAFDPATGTFGNKIDTLVDAAAVEKSVSFPRPSFDGKYILFTLMDYGNFSIWHKEADLWLLTLKDGAYRPLTEVNSDDVEAYHNWSSNSHWFVFDSRRDGGLYTRAYIACMDDNGKVGKPFLLPQDNPFVYYDELLYSYNVPEFVTEPVPLDAREAERKLMSPDRLQVGVRRTK